MKRFYEFFAGGGMVRAGLGPAWTCAFANDFDAKKAKAYRANWGDGGELHVGDVRAVTTDQLPGQADLMWGSSPCQDLSLAGAGGGLAGERSGAFYPFFDLVRGLAVEGRAPAIVAVENVCGALTSHGGRDFAAMCGAYARAGYRFGALTIDAAHFLPQSRPRLFLIGVRGDLEIDPAIVSVEPEAPFHDQALVRAAAGLSPEARQSLVWWRVAPPARRNLALADIVENDPADAPWHDAAATERLLGMMSPVNRAKVDAAATAGGRQVGCIYRRTRREPDGRRVQRAEVRFDGIAGCLRTPAGGSSRQIIVVVEGERVRTRLISARETARLMGLDDAYILPSAYNEAYHLTGDGVAVDVVRHLARTLFEPILAGGTPARRAA